MEPDKTLRLSPDQHKNILKFVNSAYRFLGGADVNLRAALEEKDRTYYRESDRGKAHVRASAANRAGDFTKLKNMTVPVVAPQIETGVAYLAEVFLTGEPFFGVVAPAANADAATQMETVISDNSRRFGWRGEFMKSFRDGLKYNWMGIDMSWETKKTFSIINDPSRNAADAGVSSEEMYAGNRAKRIDPYNAIIDTRVQPNRIHIDGEFMGYVELLPRIPMKQLVIDLGAGNTMNVTEALSSSCATYTAGVSNPNGYYVPLVNSMALLNPHTQHSWISWANNVNGAGSIQYNDMYEVATIYARFLPSDFSLKLSAQNTPQIFKLIVINQKWIIFCKRMTNAHNFFPTVITQPFDDGLGYQAKSYGDNVAPYQDMASSLWNSGIESKRRLVYDRLFYDPSRINKADIDNTNVVARIPVKQAAYGKPLSEAVWSSNYRDDNSVQTLEMAQRVQQLADVANGTNRVQQGQFQKGNKTRGEFDTTMQGANARPRMFAIAIEDTFMSPLKEIVKMNTIQYQGTATMFNQAKQQKVEVNPQDLRKMAVEFKLSDGQTPTEKLLNSDLMGQIAQIGMAIPQINAEYDVIGMLTYQWKQNGAFWLSEFKRSPEQMQQYLSTTAATSAANAEPKNRETPSESANKSPQVPVSPTK